jgi:K+-transporting ATPase ATPase C chain
MKALFSQLRSAIMAMLILAVVCCGLYPFLVYGIAQLAFPRQANGSMIVSKDGTVRGSGSDAANSGGSNLGPTSQKLADLIKERITAYRTENGLSERIETPADAVTASGSGLDPHISVRNAELQLARVAKARNFSDDKVRELIKQYTDAPDLGILGEPGVNVLKLNLALDSIK